MLKEKLTQIVKQALPLNYTAISYAISIDGKLVASDAIGEDGRKEKEKIGPKHTFNICSISKVFCTAAMMILVQQGKVNLDEPVCHYLPDLWMPDERYKQITVRHCLSHSSGLPGTQWKHFSASEVDDPDNSKYYSEVYQYLAHNKLKADPGKYSTYCNDGFTLAEMVIAKVAQMPFGQFVKQFITEPISAHSTRVSTTINPEYTVVCEKKKVPEYFYLQGCGGFTTTMEDLVKFGNLFLYENDILTQQSKDEMAKHQGLTFIPSDNKANNFGLGWDEVEVIEEIYDIGENVLMKGGNSFQFTSKLYVFPKYKAVVAVSETHDCRVDMDRLVMKLLACSLYQQKNIDICKKYVRVPEEVVNEYAGMYLMPSSIMQCRFNDDRMSFVNINPNGSEKTSIADLYYDGQYFISNTNEKYFFEKVDGNTYLVVNRNGKVIPTMMKANQYAPLSEKWQSRLSKKYIVIDTEYNDYVINEMMFGFTVYSYKEITGSISLFRKSENGFYSPIVIANDDNSASGILLTPSNGSRDLLNPEFVEEDGVEYVYNASYKYMDVDALTNYEGQGFDEDSKVNKVFKITEELTTLVEIPEKRRIIISDNDFKVVYDSLFSEKYTPVSTGYISLI